MASPATDLRDPDLHRNAHARLDRLVAEQGDQLRDARKRLGELEAFVANLATVVAKGGDQ